MWEHCFTPETYDKTGVMLGPHVTVSVRLLEEAAVSCKSHPGLREQEETVVRKFWDSLTLWRAHTEVKDRMSERKPRLEHLP